MRKVIVCVAPVASPAGATAHKPLTPAEIARDVADCANAGASMVHLHVRDEQGGQTHDLQAFSRTLDLIRDRSDLVIQGSTGGVAGLTLAQRCVSLDDPRVEVASLNMGSVNLGDEAYINTLPDVRFWAQRMKDRGIRPELEIFEAGMIANAALLVGDGHLDAPFFFSFCLGFRGALPASPYNLLFLHGLIPAGARWGLVHHGMEDLSLLAVALGMGAASIRVGFEDGIHCAPGRRAKTNAELVGRAVELVRIMGMEAAAPDEARRLLGIQGRRPAMGGTA